MKYIDLQKKITHSVFSTHDLKLLGVKVFGYQLSLWQKQGHIVKIKNGLYVFADRLAAISPEEISGLLYSPSYISLEKALSFYGVIPEMVYSVTSVTPKVTRRFKNKLGSFIYRHIKPSLHFGYRQLKGENIPYLMAEPEKALLDYIYLNLSRLKTDADLDEMRFNRKTLQKLISKPKLKKYLSIYKNKKMKSICNKLC